MKNQKVSSGAPRVATLPWKGKKPFYGWIIVSAGVVTQFFQGITNQGFATYLPELQRQFGWSRAALAAPRSVTQVENSSWGRSKVTWLTDSGRVSWPLSAFR